MPNVGLVGNNVHDLLFIDCYKGIVVVLLVDLLLGAFGWRKASLFVEAN